MAKVLPFKAVRPHREKVSLVSSRSYESYTDSELGAQLEFNPYSFLHIVNPGYKFQHETPSSERFKMVKNRYTEYKENNILLKDKKASFYIYRKVSKNHEYCGIIAATSSEDYENNSIKKHEETIKDREILFGKYLKKVGFNAEPILLTYPDNSEIQKIIDKYKNQRSEYEFTSQNMNSHQLWLVSDDVDIEKITSEFKKIKALYIADGHHRSASSAIVSKNLKENNPSHNGTEDYNFFMSFLIPESSLKISSFNRFIRDLNGLTKHQFLIELDKLFRITNLGQQLYKPSKKHHFSMYLDGEFYSLYLRKTIYKIENPLSDLDAQLLFDTVLKPILGITNLRDGEKIKYKPGKNAEIDLKTEVDSEKFKVSFGLFPATVDQLKAIADANLKMPPKSTYIEPKLRSALTLYEF
jgi:uncharacterized protein (DUF1015 family)|tara:strand:+ start:2240 stop:3475 length:1236 start_codon:yes stop_codon:yes gene_type:complete